MTAYGIPQAAIARLVYHPETGKHVTALTLRKYFKNEIYLGLHKANMKVAQSLFQKATGNDKGAVTAAMFWLRCRAGWTDRTITEHRLVDEEGTGPPTLVIEVRDPTIPRDVKPPGEVVDLRPVDSNDPDISA